MTLATQARVFVKIPQGPRIASLVKEVIGGYPDDAHRDKPHDWHALLHYESQDAPFAECICGAIGQVQ